MSDQELITQAIRCDLWPKWLGDIVDKTADSYVDKYDMSTEQAVAYGILLYIQSKEIPEQSFILDPNGWCETAAIFGGTSCISLAAPHIVEYKRARLKALGANFTEDFSPTAGWKLVVKPKS